MDVVTDVSRRFRGKNAEKARGRDSASAVYIMMRETQHGATHSATAALFDGHAKIILALDCSTQNAALLISWYTWHCWQHSALTLGYQRHRRTQRSVFMQVRRKLEIPTAAASLTQLTRLALEDSCFSSCASAAGTSGRTGAAVWIWSAIISSPFAWVPGTQHNCWILETAGNQLEV